jgi:hypothetical protein
MYLRTNNAQDTAGLGWFVDTKIGPTTVSAGHEELTEKAAAGLVGDKALLRALVDGARRPDLADPRDHIKAGEEQRHFLRAGLRESPVDAWDKSIEHLRGLHQQILAAPSLAPSQFSLIGEVLHLIQDGYAPADVERQPAATTSNDPRASEIVDVRYYGIFPFVKGAHVHRIDSRDNIRDQGTLKPEAIHAITAGRAYLRMVLGHIQKGLPASQIAEELEGFIREFLRMRMPVIRRGARGAAVKELQRRLNLWIVRSGVKRPPLPVSGTFGDRTREAVWAFQRATGLKVDGVVGRPIWQSLPVR